MNKQNLSTEDIIEQLRPSAFNKYLGAVHCAPPCSYKFTFDSEEDRIESYEDFLSQAGKCKSLFKMTDEPPCRDYQPKYDFRSNGEIYKIVSVQEPDE